MAINDAMNGVTKYDIRPDRLTEGAAPPELVVRSAGSGVVPEAAAGGVDRRCSGSPKIPPEVHHLEVSGRYDVLTRERRWSN